jgi:hypothetical protein
MRRQADADRQDDLQVLGRPLQHLNNRSPSTIYPFTSHHKKSEQLPKHY